MYTEKWDTTLYFRLNDKRAPSFLPFRSFTCSFSIFPFLMPLLALHTLYACIYGTALFFYWRNRFKWAKQIINKANDDATLFYDGNLFRRYSTNLRPLRILLFSSAYSWNSDHRVFVRWFFFFLVVIRSLQDDEQIHFWWIMSANNGFFCDAMRVTPVCLMSIEIYL